MRYYLKVSVAYRTNYGTAGKYQLGEPIQFQSDVEYDNSRIFLSKLPFDDLAEHFSIITDMRNSKVTKIILTYYAMDDFSVNSTITYKVERN